MPEVIRVAEADFDGGDECGKPLTKAQVRAIINQTHRRWVMMSRQGLCSVAEEAAFVNGAVACFFACKNATDIPAHWVFPSVVPLMKRLEKWKKEGKLNA